MLMIDYKTQNQLSHRVRTGSEMVDSMTLVQNEWSGKFVSEGPGAVVSNSLADVLAKCQDIGTCWLRSPPEVPRERQRASKSAVLKQMEENKARRSVIFFLSLFEIVPGNLRQISLRKLPLLILDSTCRQQYTFIGLQ